jgi:hypothetical protein
MLILFEVWIQVKLICDARNQYRGFLSGEMKDKGLGESAMGTFEILVKIYFLIGFVVR